MNSSKEVGLRHSRHACHVTLKGRKAMAAAKVKVRELFSESSWTAAGAQTTSIESSFTTALESLSNKLRREQNG
jgi:hypothetical protein